MKSTDFFCSNPAHKMTEWQTRHMRLDSDLTTALYKSFTYLLTYLHHVTSALAKVKKIGGLVRFDKIWGLGAQPRTILDYSIRCVQMSTALYADVLTFMFMKSRAYLVSLGIQYPAHLLLNVTMPVDHVTMTSLSVPPYHRFWQNNEQEVKVIWHKAPHGGPIPRLGVTPGVESCTIEFLG